MIRDYRLRLARWMITVRNSQLAGYSMVQMWLPIWGVFTVILIGLPLIGGTVILIAPVAALARFFTGRKRGEAILHKIGNILMLRHPLAQSLQQIGNAEPGLIGIRLITLGELLERGRPLADALRTAVPEIPARRRMAIAEAENAGMLLQEFARRRASPSAWNISNELDLAAFMSVGLGMCMLPIGFWLAICVMRPILNHTSQPNIYPTPSFYSDFGFIAPPAIYIFIEYAAILLLGAIALRRWAVPFLRQIFWLAYMRDAVAWRLPICAGIVRDRSWADAATILATGMRQGRPLNELAEAAGGGAMNRVAQRRLLRWSVKLSRGFSPADAARKSGLPPVMCAATEGPLGENGSGFQVAAQFFDLRYRRRVAWLQAAGVPVAVVALGMLVLWVMLLIVVPYIQIINFYSKGV